MKNFLIEIILGYQFWTLFLGLAPLIWFYPLNELEITGFELFALVIFSPILYYIPKFNILLKTKVMNIILRSLCLLGIYSFQFSTTFYRLLFLSIGCFAQLLLLYQAVNENKRNFLIDGLLFGFVLLVACRMWLTSFIPAWWNKEYNSFHFLLFFIINIDQLYAQDKTTLTNDSSKPSTITSLVMGWSFGSWLYVSQVLIADSALICRWTVSGYPNPGPMPYPWGLLIFVAMLVGILVSFSDKTIVKSCIWWIGGVLSFLVLYYFSSWTAFLGGIYIAVFLVSIFPLLLHHVILNSKSPLCFLVAFFVWLFEMLFSVWTVAYNFVPGGIYTRERTDIILYLALSSFALFFISTRISNTAWNIEIRSYKFDKKIFTALLLVLLLYFSAFISRYPKQNFTHHPKNGILTTAIWTVHFGYDNDGWPSLQSIASVLNDTDADVLALLESDASKPFLGNNDIAMWLSESLSMYVDFGPATKKHTWGNLLLSKYPIIKSKHHLLPSPEGELAPAITATINVSGNLLDVALTHMGNSRDVLDRKLQSEYLSHKISLMTNPLIFMGYMTSAPKSDNYFRYLNSGRMKDIDPSDMDRWCQYIFYRNLLRIGYARISHGGLTDTEIQVGRFLFPNGDQKDNERVDISTNKIHKDFHFNKIFGKHYVGHYYDKKHHFHMNTPKYFY